MTDRPILFSGPMVRALLSGTKTQTRRILDLACDEPPAFVEGGIITALDADDRPYRWPRTHAVGDRLYVRETWTHTGTGVWTIADTHRALDGAVAYHADGAILGAKYWPSIHMPRWASRITLTVTDVRVQRLQDISEADAIAEGIERADDFFGCPCWKCYGDQTDTVAPDDPIGSYQTLWEHINGPGAWDANPWVAAYTFTVALGNIDELARAP